MSDTTATEIPQYDSEYENSTLIFNDEDNIEDMYLTFGVSGEEYGIGISYVTEVVGMQRIMEVPDVPNFIKGVINLRGKVIPIMDIRLRFGLEAKPYTPRTVIIVLDIDNVMIGLVVDYVREVIEIPENQIDLPSRFNENNVIRGFGKQKNKVAIILDIQRLVSNQTIELHNVLDSAKMAE